VDHPGSSLAELPGRVAVGATGHGPDRVAAIEELAGEGAALLAGGAGHQDRSVLLGFSAHGYLLRGVVRRLMGASGSWYLLV
jgi:hypothetical protein